MIDLLALVLVTAVDVSEQRIHAVLSPADGTVTATSQLDVRGTGTLRLHLHEQAAVASIMLDGEPVSVEPAGAGIRSERHVRVPRDGTVRLEYTATLREDVAAGERPGQIHNFAVQAHIGMDGVFLSDGSAWHPRPLDASGVPQLHRISITVESLDGWVVVGAGDPADHTEPALPCWHWRTPRPVDGMALVGNRHEIRVRRHASSGRAVDIVMYAGADQIDKADLFLDAADTYLGMYQPLLGDFPYARFTIVENFFSSGFAFPGFTVLGPQVVGMAPRSLAPGYLDHELLHNWWGNGVYVDQSDGNWCEALTSFSTNYHRRILDDGPEAGRAYRRGILMKLSTDPAGLDDGTLGSFGSADPAAGGSGRFVGYDKGTFVFSMLTDVLGGDEPMWSALRRFARNHLGHRAGWSDLQSACEAEQPRRPAGWLAGFFETWVQGHLVPQTIVRRADPLGSFAEQFVQSPLQQIDVAMHDGGNACEIDPDFRLYRVLPPEQIVPTIAGTTGVGGVRVVTDPDRTGVSPVDGSDDGENLLLIGPASVATHGRLIARTTDPIEIETGAFTVGGRRYDGPDMAALHTMQHPDRPGRFITVFHSNGDEGWAQVRLIRFYTRDTTVIWSGRRPIERRTFEPDRLITLP